MENQTDTHSSAASRPHTVARAAAGVALIALMALITGLAVSCAQESGGEEQSPSDASLASLSISTGSLSPSFASATTAYSLSVPNATSGITVTPTANNPLATIRVRVNGGAYATVPSGNASLSLALNVGSNGIDVAVTAVDGTVRTYGITVTREAAGSASLSALSVTSERIYPAFDAGVQDYSCTVASDIASIKIRPTAAGSGASVTVNGATVASGSESQAISLATGINTVTVTVSGGGASRTYSVAVKRATRGPLVTVDFTYGQDNGSSYSNIYAIWLEKEDGTLIQNLYVCNRLLPGGGLTNTALPYWSCNKYDAAEVDGVSGATEAKKNFTVSGYLKDNDIGKFRICFESDHSFDPNDWFTDQPAILYSALVDRSALASPYTLDFEAWTPNEGTVNTLSAYIGTLVKGTKQTLGRLKYITHQKDESSGNPDKPFGGADPARSSTRIVGDITATVE